MRWPALRPVAPWLVVAAVLAGCASGPPGAAPGGALPSGRDGAEANPPADLARVPDAEPRLEPIRIGGPNKPYEQSGRSYVPITQDAPFTERGPASWYGRKFQGRRTASGEVYNMYAMTAAHPTLPIPSYARIRNPANGREVIVRVNDRGPFHSNRIVDLSYTAALRLDLLRGVAPVELTRITFDEIRTGAWRRDSAPMGLPVAVPDSVVASAVVVPAAATPDVAAQAPPPRTAPPVAPASAPASASAPAPASAPAATPPSPSPSPSPPVVVPADTVVATAVDDAPTRPIAAQARGFWVQLGAYRQRIGAEAFQQRVAVELDWLSPLLAIFNDAAMFRLQAGPYPTRDDARLAADRIRGGLKLVPVIIERR